MKKLLIALLTLMLGMTPALAAEIPGLVWERSMEKTYATEFNVDYFEGGYALIEVIGSASYLVVPEGMPVPEGLDGSIRVLRQPLDRIYLQATSGMALIDRLHAEGVSCNLFYADDAENYRRYFDMGVDTLLTNRMDLAAQYRREQEYYCNGGNGNEQGSYAR